jgi:hypothetical protein
VPRFLRNPFVLGGMAIVGAIVAAVVLAVLFSEGEKETVIVTPAPEASTAGSAPTETPVSVEGIRAHALSTLTVRAGPDTSYISLGIARRGAELDVVGKNGDESWLEISYPPRSQLRGWVEADGVELEGSLASLPVATPEALVLPVVPTYPPGAFVEGESDLTPTSEAPPLPDLVLSDVYLSDGELVVTVTNQGTASAAAPIDVAVYSGDGSVFLRRARVFGALAAGASADLAIQYEPAEGPQRLLIRVDPSDRVEEANEDNNEVLVGVSGVPASPSPTAPGSPTAAATPQPGLPAFTPTQTVPASTPAETPTSPVLTPTPTAESTPVGGG